MRWAGIERPGVGPFIARGALKMQGTDVMPTSRQPGPAGHADPFMTSPSPSVLVFDVNETLDPTMPGNGFQRRSSHGKYPVIGVIGPPDQPGRFQQVVQSDLMQHLGLEPVEHREPKSAPSVTCGLLSNSAGRRIYGQTFGHWRLMSPPKPNQEWKGYPLRQPGTLSVTVVLTIR
jgi:hypothetical protein